MSDASSAGRVSVLTPAGRGAIAVVAAVGQGALAAADACFHAANGRRFTQQGHDRIVFGHWVSGNHREEVIVVRGDGESLEIHCHGGAAAVARIVAALAAAGCEIEPWQRWMERSSQQDDVAHEANVALAAATTRRTAAILLDQLGGALTREVAVAQVELQQHKLDEARDRLAALLAVSRPGLHLTSPWQVAIAGAPNVGKSSLLNALVGYQRAIVFDQPGTTRDVLSAETAIDGWPVRLTDAAGIRESADPLEAEGVALARRQISDADLVLWVFDATVIPRGCDLLAVARGALEAEKGASAENALPVVVLNKCDLLERDPPARHPSVIAVSALVGTGIDALLVAIAERLVPTPPRRGAGVPFTSRQVMLLESALKAIDRGDIDVASGRLARLAQSAGEGAS